MAMVISSSKRRATLGNLGPASGLGDNPGGHAVLPWSECAGCWMQPSKHCPELQGNACSCCNPGSEHLPPRSCRQHSILPADHEPPASVFWEIALIQLATLSKGHSPVLPKEGTAEGWGEQLGNRQLNGNYSCQLYCRLLQIPNALQKTRAFM